MKKLVYLTSNPNKVEDSNEYLRTLYMTELVCIEEELVMKIKNK